MNDIVTQPNITLHEGQPMTTSLDVAERFGKRHTEVLRAMSNLECSDEFRQRNFASASYMDAQDKPRPMYHITKNGFAFLAMGFTGKEAARWKEAYITAFDAMEQELRRIQQEAADRHFQMLNDVLTGLFDNHPNWQTIRTFLGLGKPVEFVMQLTNRKSASSIYRAIRQMADHGLMEKGPVKPEGRRQRWRVPAGQPLKFQLVR